MSPAHSTVTNLVTVVGHDAPLGYPGPATAIVESSGRLFVVVSDDNGVGKLQPLEEGAEFVHWKVRREDGGRFDYPHERLFAMSVGHVERYRKENEASFFDKLIQAHGKQFDDPFMLWHAAKLSGNDEHKRRAAEACETLLRTFPDAVREHWRATESKYLPERPNAPRRAAVVRAPRAGRGRPAEVAAHLVKEMTERSWELFDQVAAAGSELLPFSIERMAIVVREMLGYELDMPPTLGVDLGGAEHILGQIEPASKVISVASKVAPARRSFTLAHEIGHALLHPDLMLHRDTAATIGSMAEGTEREANLFAAHFLMPQDEIQREFLERFGGPITREYPEDDLAYQLSIGRRSIVEPRALRAASPRHVALWAAMAGDVSLASLFGVSNTAIAIRLEELGLVRWTGRSQQSTELVPTPRRVARDAIKQHDPVGSEAPSGDTELGRASEEAVENPLGSEVRMFICYAKRDAHQRDRLMDNLKERVDPRIMAKIKDAPIGVGANAARVVQKQLVRSNLLVLFVSRELLRFIQSEEMKTALQREQAGEMVVVPVIMRECAWKESAIGHLHVLPRGAKPVAMLKNPDDAFARIGREIHDLIFSRWF